MAQTLRQQLTEVTAELLELRQAYKILRLENVASEQAKDKIIERLERKIKRMKKAPTCGAKC